MKTLPHIRTNVSADGIVFLDSSRGLVLSANKVAAQIWQLMQDGEPESEIAHAIVRDWNVPPDIAARDVREFMDSLVAQGVVTAG